MEEYSLLPLWNSVKRRMMDVTKHFVPWTPNPCVVKSMQSEMAFLRAVIGRRRLEQGHEMPPFSTFLHAVQTALSAEKHPVFDSLPRNALMVATGSEGPEPVDSTGFPKWWLTFPKAGPGPNTPPFNLSAWIIEQAQDSLGDAANAEDADVGEFVEQLSQVLQRLRGLQTSAIERAKAIVALHRESEGAFKQMHDARQNAATLAQRRYEEANGLPHLPVPFQGQMEE